MKKNLFILLILMTSIMQAQLISKHIELQELGLSFDIPNGWSGQVEGEYIVLGHKSIPGMMLLVKNNSNTAQELKDLAMQGFKDEGIYLNPSDEFKIVNSTRVEGTYMGQYNGTPVEAFVVGLVNDLGSGLSLLVLTETDKFTSTHIQEANTLLSTVRFSQPKRESTEQVQFWKNRLTGKILRYMHSRSSNDYSGGTTGYNESRTLSLCNDGRFTYYSNAHAAVDTGTNAGGFLSSNGNKSGHYEIYNSNNSMWLKLTFESGELHEAELTTDEQRLKTFIDGSRYYLDGEAECQ